jgi:Tfp pilus assembly protein PilO
MKLLSKQGFNITIKTPFLESLLPRFKEERIGAFLTLGATLLAISVFGFFAINPTITTIVQLRKQLADEKYVDQALVTKIANLSTLQQNYTQIQSTIPTVLDAIPPLPTIPLLAAQIQSIAQTSGVTVVTLQTLPVEVTAESSANYLSFVFSVSVKGTTSSINNFISSLESFERLVTLDEFSIVTAPDNSNISQATFKGKVYFKKV